MKKIRIEIQVTLLSIFILVVLALSGYLVYQSLSQIVSSIHKEARPDLKLMLIKDIASDLTEIENTVRLYTLSDDANYLTPYRTLSESIDEKLTSLQDYVIPETETKIYIDSMQVLTNQKMVIWDRILALHYSKADAHQTFSDYYQKLDTVVIPEDTIHFEQAEKKGFLKRLFGKKPEPPKPVIVDHSAEKDKMREEISSIEKEIAANAQLLVSREKVLLQKNIEVTELLSEIISELEYREQQNLLRKTQEADRLASLTYKRLAYFTIAALILIFLVLALFYRDLRKSRAYQKILHKAKIEAEKLARAKELFVATVSHEMRTPINAIFGLTEQLFHRNHDEETQKDLEIIHKSTKHLINLVNDTFDFSKIENQKLELKPVDFLLDELLDDVIMYNKDAATKKGIQLHLVREATSGLVLFGDSIRLKQILINLVTNAIKFTNKGSVSLKIRSEEINDKIMILVEVIDTGIGIPQESHELIFNDFVQLETDITHKARGTGLGLYIVKKLVDLLGGQIKLESTLGFGSTFKLSIPFLKGRAENIQSFRPDVVIPEILKKKHVLIVDDEEFNRHLLKGILTRWGLPFQLAENGQEAIERVSKHTFDLVLMDIRMPVMNGLDAAREIRLNNNFTKIIALSATNKEEDFKLCRQAGMENCLTKPFSEAGLLDIIVKTLVISFSEPASIEKITEEKPLGIDLSELENMANGDRQFLREMITIFINSNKNNLSLIQEYMVDRNWQAMADIAHKMAAPAKHMQVNQLYSRIKQFQSNAEEGKDPEELTVLFGQMKEDINIINQYLQDLIDNDKL